MTRAGTIWPTVLAGVVAGLAGVALFGLAHAILIVPIWSRLFRGVAFAIVAGIALAWAYQELRASGTLSANVVHGLLFGALVWITLIPATAVSSLFRVVELRDTLGAWEVVVVAALALATGGSLGWALTRSARAAVSLGLAALSATIVMGGPIPLVNSARAAGLFVAFLAVYAISGVALVTVLMFVECRTASSARMSASIG